VRKVEFSKPGGRVQHFNGLALPYRSLHWSSKLKTGLAAQLSHDYLLRHVQIHQDVICRLMQVIPFQSRVLLALGEAF
jgi:hypothetical protein